MKIIDLLNKIANGEEVPKKIKYENKFLYFDNEDNEDNNYRATFNYYDEEGNSELFTGWVGEYLNDEVEIIEEKKKFTKEDFINERMGIDNITRKEFDEMYEVKECNCGMPYCKGFIAVDKEEQQEHKIPEKLKLYTLSDNDSADFTTLQDFNNRDIQRTINWILDYLEEEKNGRNI